MRNLKTLYLQQEDLISAGLLDFKRSLLDVEKGLVWHTTKKSLSGKVALELDPKKEWKFNSLSSVNGDYSACKWLGSHLDNKFEDLPRSIATIILNEKKSGKPLCIMEGTLISAIRTGCYAALGLKYLGQEKNNIGIIGSGVMAKVSLLAMLENNPEKIDNVFVYSRTKSNREHYSNQIESMSGFKINPVDNVKELVNNCDITVSAITKNDEILVYDKDVKIGSTHIHIGGWDDEENYILRCANSGKIICDDWEAIKKRNAHPLPLAYSKGIILERQIYGNIGEIILGQKAGREGNEPIYFDTVGLGEMDLVLAISLYENAIKKGLGKELDLWNEKHWILGGYNE